MTALLELFHSSPGLFLGFVAALGLCVGSFLNVVIYRLPMRMHFDWITQCREYLAASREDGTDDIGETAPSLISPPSACPKCGNRLKAWHNIPVVSWLLLRGRCGFCGATVSARYPLVELLTALLCVAVAWRFGISWQTVAGIVLTWMLVALSFIDFDRQLLPDNITLPGIWLGLVLNLFGVFTDLQSAVVGAVAGYLVLWTVFQLFKLVTGKEGMGFGDFKLLAMLGAWFGWQVLPLVVLLSAVAGAVIGIAFISLRGRDKDVPMPFGPYLSIAGWIAMMWGPAMISAYLHFSGVA